MHILQALKMAFKSLWTNKMRSFLTMLGIIIGVMTVALLTSVASGVSEAVVSQIRSQSTLSIVMASSDKMTYSVLDRALKRNQPEDKNADDYYEYSLVKSQKTIVANDEILPGYDSSDIKGMLKQEKIYTDEDLKKFIGTAFEPYIEMYRFKNPAPINTEISLVDSNFLKVFDLEFDGTFPKTDSEVMVDETFVKINFGENVSLKSVIGNKITVGVLAYDKIIVKFKESVSDEIKESICSELVKVENKLGVRIIQNEDGTNYTNGENNIIVINIEFYKRLELSELRNNILNKLGANEEISSKLADGGVSVSEVYDGKNAKVFTITAVISSENANIFGNSSSSDEDSDEPAISMSGSTSKGEIYMLLDESSFECVGIKGYSSVQELPVTYGYIRYKTEKVMSKSTSAIMVDIVMNEGLVFGEDFMLVSMDSVSKIVSKVMSVLTTMLTVISVISLIVGGIGIMNIMLVAVTERTREIGIRKAIGAKRSSILVQFLIEALLLALIGGLIGLGISAIGCAIIGHVMKIKIMMPLWQIAMSVGFCTLIGLIFGMFPAVKASRMQPIDALRRE